MGIIIAIVTFLVLTFIFLEFKNNTTVKETFNIHLASLGYYYRSGKDDIVNLNQYFIDKDNKLYSINLDTWEINKRKGRDILICSDFTLNDQGETINTLRDMKGTKVTVKRSSFNFRNLASTNTNFIVTVKNTGDRHLKIVTPERYSSVS